MVVVGVACDPHYINIVTSLLAPCEAFAQLFTALFIRMRNRKKKYFLYLITNRDPRTLSQLASRLFCPPVMSDREEPAFHSFETKLVIQLTVYTPNKASAGSGKNKKKSESKAKKTKEATFTLSSDNHLEFLQCLLTKHGQNTIYKVTERKRFSFKYLYPVSKAYVTIESFFSLINFRPVSGMPLTLKMPMTTARW